MSSNRTALERYHHCNFALLKKDGLGFLQAYYKTRKGILNTF